MRFSKIMHFALIFSLMVLSLSAPVQGLLSTETVTNPSVDAIHRPIITYESGMVSALIAGDIDVIGSPITWQHKAQLQEAENIEVVDHLSNGYDLLLVNCEKYPLNVTSFRRALAHAIDKVNYVDAVRDGNGLPHDSVIPRGFPLSIEDELTANYYDSDISAAQNLLTQAGFSDFNDDGFIQAPDESDIYLEISVSEHLTFLDEMMDVLQTAFDSLSINHSIIPVNLSGFFTPIWSGDYDLAHMGNSFFSVFDPRNNPMNDFRSQWISDMSYYNMARFANSSYDLLFEEMLEVLTYEELVSIIKEMQELLWYESPWIVLSQSHMVCAYRTDKFAGFMDTPLHGVGGWWSLMHAQLIDGSGGTVHCKLDNLRHQSVVLPRTALGLTL